MKVLFVPGGGNNNPYQALLARALADVGVGVERRTPTGPLALSRAVAAVRPDVLHLHWTDGFVGSPRRLADALKPAALLADAAAVRARGVPLVWTVHELWPHESRHPSRDRAVHGLLARICSRVVVHCESARAAVVESFGLGRDHAAKVRVVPHPSYRGAYPEGPPVADARARLGLPQGARVFLFLGKIRGYKGVDRLVEAFSRIPGPQLRLVVAGEPADARAVEATSRVAATDGRIVLRAATVAKAEIPVYLAAADAVVLPFGRVLTSGSAILAMTHGRPVITPRLGCLPDLVDAATGIVYEPDRPGALDGALRVAATADLAALGRAARAAADAVDPAAVARATRAVYDEALGRG